MGKAIEDAKAAELSRIIKDAQDFVQSVFDAEEAVRAAKLAKIEAKQQAILEARRQPKSEAEEKAIADRYAAMESWEERAFNILLDVGMIEQTPDPDDPEYDAEYDNELFEDQRYIN